MSFDCDYEGKELRTILEVISEGYGKHSIVFDDFGNPIDYKFLCVNTAFEKITGLKKEDIINKNAYDVLAKLDKKWLKIYAEVALNGITKDFISYSNVLNKNFKVRAFSNKKNEFVTIFYDIGRVDKTQEIEMKYNLLHENSRDIILFIKTNGTIIDANRTAILKYEYSYDEIIGMNVDELRKLDEKDFVKKQLEIAIKKGITFEAIHVKKNGDTFPVEVNSQYALYGKEKILISIIRDISYRKKLEEELKYQANYDFLTKIYNRNFAIPQLDVQIKASKRGNTKFAVFYFDIDDFKTINDDFGHEWGDYVLKEFVNRIKKVVRESDVFSRMGGDEFSIILKIDKSEDEVKYLINRILKIMNKPMDVDGHIKKICISIGVSIFPKDGKNAKEIMASADKAMYEAKKVSGNSYYIR